METYSELAENTRSGPMIEVKEERDLEQPFLGGRGYDLR